MVNGERHGLGVAPPSQHRNLAWATEERKRKVGVRSLITAPDFGPLVISMSIRGASTVHDLVTVGPVLPARSVGVTEKV